MSRIGDVLEMWREFHEQGVCQDGVGPDGTTCPICEAKRLGCSVADLMEG